MRKKIAVYGSYGLNGSHVVRDLSARGHEPVLCGRDVDALAKLSRDFGSRYQTVVTHIDDPSFSIVC